MVRETLIFILITDRLRFRLWVTFVDVNNAKNFHKSGKENYVADALSRQNIQKKSEDLHVLEEKAFSDIAIVHSELYLTYTIEANDKPVNYFNNIIVLPEANFPQNRKLIIFTEKN